LAASAQYRWRARGGTVDATGFKTLAMGGLDP